MWMEHPRYRHCMRKRQRTVHIRKVEKYKRPGCRRTDAEYTEIQRLLTLHRLIKRVLKQKVNEFYRDSGNVLGDVSKHQIAGIKIDPDLLGCVITRATMLVIRTRLKADIAYSVQSRSFWSKVIRHEKYLAGYYHG